jgi:hypothetical protein
MRSRTSNRNREAYVWLCRGLRRRRPRVRDGPAVRRTTSVSSLLADAAGTCQEDAWVRA